MKIAIFAHLLAVATAMTLPNGVPPEPDAAKVNPPLKISDPANIVNTKVNVGGEVVTANHSVIAQGVTEASVAAKAPKAMKRKMKKSKNPGLQPVQDDTPDNLFVKGIGNVPKRIVTPMATSHGQSKLPDSTTIPDEPENKTSGQQFVSVKYELPERLPIPNAQSAREVMESGVNNFPEPGVMAALQSWLAKAINYFGTGAGEDVKRVEGIKQRTIVVRE